MALITNFCRADTEICYRNPANSPLWGCAGDRVEMVSKCIVRLFWATHIQHGGKFVPQDSLTMHFDSHLDSVSRATSKWLIERFRVTFTANVNFYHVTKFSGLMINLSFSVHSRDSRAQSASSGAPWVRKFWLFIHPRKKQQQSRVFLSNKF